MELRQTLEPMIAESRRTSTTLCSRGLIARVNRSIQCAIRQVEVAPAKTGESHQRQRPLSVGRLTPPSANGDLRRPR